MENEQKSSQEGSAEFSLEAIKRKNKLIIGEEQVLLNILSQMHAKNAIEQTRSEEQIQKIAMNTLERYRSAHLSRLSAMDRAEHLQNSKVKQDAEIKEERARLQRQIDMYEALGEYDASYNDTIAKHKAELAEKEKKWASDQQKLQKSLVNAKIEALKEEEKLKKDSIDRGIQYEKEKKKNTGIKGAITQAKEGNILDPKSGALANLLNGASKATPAGLKENLAQNAKDKRAKADASAERVDELNNLYSELKESGADEETLAKVLKEGQEAQLEATKDANAAAAAEMANAVADAISGQYTQAVNQAETILNDYMGIIDARMQGSDKNFKDMSNMISSNLSLSPFVKTTKVLDQLKQAADKGISYNIEQRSFLSSISDRIATTFDAFDSNLMRIIRLQQADSTASRLGMEASLTKLFNNMFEDTSYLSNVADSISGAIVDAQSQLNHKAAAEFEYVVQKWLGSLSSLGMSDDALNEIAKGINSLATGDVKGLASNESMQTMFAMAASNANLEYSELLLKGLDANTTNKLLESMVVYLKSIADNSENQVVKAAYGDIFNLSHSDMRALSNITQSEINSLADNMMSYDQMQTELNNQFDQLVKRTSLSTLLTNVYENVLYGVASDMVNNPVTFAMQKMLNWMDETKTDIYIPFVNAAGFGLDLNTSVKGLMQMGLGISQGLSLAGNILAGLSSGGGLNLDSWDASETTRRGNALELTTLSTLGGVSGSIGTFATSANTSDIKNSTMSAATDDAEETKKITNKNSKPPDKTMDDLYKAIVGDSAEAYVRVQDSILEAVYQSDLESLRVYIKDSEVVNNRLLVHDPEVSSDLKYQNPILSNLNTLLIGVTNGSGDTFVSTRDSTLEKIYSDASQAMNVNLVGISDSIPFLTTLTSSFSDPISTATTTILGSISTVEGKVDSNYGSIVVDLGTLLTTLETNKPKDPDYTSIINAIKGVTPQSTDLSEVIKEIKANRPIATDLSKVTNAIDDLKTSISQTADTSVLVTINDKLDTTLASLAVDQSSLIASMEGTLKSVLGQTSESSIRVDNKVLDMTYNTTSQSLKFSLDGLSYNEGRIPVFDAAVENTVKSGLTTINTTLMDHVANGVQTVKLVEGTIIKLDKEQLTSALKEVLFDNEANNFNDLLNTIVDGNLKVNSINNAVEVKNATGEKLQVSNLVW